MFEDDSHLTLKGLVLFNETDAFNEIIKDGYFDIFSNSYLLILGDDVNVIYSKYSNESRQDLYAIRTSITEDIEVRPTKNILFSKLLAYLEE